MVAHACPLIFSFSGIFLNNKKIQKFFKYYRKLNFFRFKNISLNFQKHFRFANSF